MAGYRRGFATILVMVLCVTSLAPRGTADGLIQRPTLDGLLAAYLGGDFAILQRTFVRSPDIHSVLRLNKPRELERWLGAWDRGKALFLLECARTSADVAPQYVSVIVRAGRQYLATARDSNAGSNHTAEFVQGWHRAAIGVLLGASDPSVVEAYAADPASANGGPSVAVDARLLLSRAVAQERRCWTTRPSLNQPAGRVEALLESAGVRVPDDPVGPTKVAREAGLARYNACLREALTRFEAAAAIEEVSAEARVRGGWTLFQDGRPAEAIAWLDAARPRGDRDLEYWRGLFRARVLDALGRFEDAVIAYRAALILSPRAQSAGTGLVIALMHLDRTQEADEIARVIREADATTPDPWLHYSRGDERFVSPLLESLRAAVR